VHHAIARAHHLDCTRVLAHDGKSELLAHQIIRRPAKQVLGRRVRESDCTLSVGDDDAIRHPLHDHAQVTLL